jgi:hypothetical protein
MTETKPTLQEMYEQLMLEYDETMHEEEEYYNPEGYQEYLDGLSDDELTELYNDKYGDY